MTEKIHQTRHKFNQRIGEIIESAIGLDGVKQVFDAAERGDEDAKAQVLKAADTGFAPSGMLALKLGIVDKETKDALLIAQAAERTLLAIEELERFYDSHVPAMQGHIKNDKSGGALEDMMRSPHTDTVNEYYKDHIKPANTIDPSFKFIGSQGDPEPLVSAQALYQLMTIYEKNEKDAMREVLIGQATKIPEAMPFGCKYVDGFKQCAANAYARAAEIVEAKGYAELSNEMRDVAVSVDFDAENAGQHPPVAFSRNLVWMENKLTMDVNMALDPVNVRPDHPYFTVSQEWVTTVEKCGQRVEKCGL